MIVFRTYDLKVLPLWRFRAKQNCFNNNNGDLILVTNHRSIGSMIGNNISLRALEPDDARILYLWENDPEVWKVSNTIAPYSRFDIDQYILNSGDIYTSKQLRLMMILTADPSILAGAIDLFDFDPLNRRAEIGILVNNEYRGKGYAQEAIELIKDYSFNTLNLHQIYCHVPVDKEINIHLFKKCGFVMTGTRKHWRWDKDQWTDEYLMQLIPNKAG